MLRALKRVSKVVSRNENLIMNSKWSKNQKLIGNMVRRQIRCFSSVNDVNQQKNQALDVDQLNKNEEIDKLSILNSEDPKYFRNIAIIAHVDHGKTTLVDSLLKSGGIKDLNTCAMDNNELEQEKGITILSKCTGITYKGHKINIVDTPGHSDFGGEVERIMSMVDGVALVICATEGPMTQSKFVLQKALKQNLKPIVIINKVDRPTARVQEVENEIFDLFCSLDASDDILDYPVFYASAKAGWAKKSMDQPNKGNMEDLMDAIIQHVPHPKVDVNDKFTMLVTQTESNQYFGRMLIGRIQSGSASLGQQIVSIDQDGNRIESAKIFKIIRRYGLNQIEMAKAVAGDIVSIAGLNNSTVTHTLNDYEHESVIPSVKIDPPMLSIQVNANTSPISGREGTKLTNQLIKEYLKQEGENDVSLKVELGKQGSSQTNITVSGRGDLHLGVLFERMRRDGFEMQISPPEVILRKNADGTTEEPVENVKIEIAPEYVPGIIEKMTNRKAEYLDCAELKDGRQRLSFNITTRGLIGLRSQFLNDTKGTVIMQTQFSHYESFKGSLKKSTKGALVSMASGECTIHALKQMETFGKLFVAPNDKVYNGMVVGENMKESDMELNAVREKELNNIRTKAHEEIIRLNPPKKFSIEEAISYAREDELIEVTPKNIRLRKKELDPSMRNKLRRESKGK